MGQPHIHAHVCENGVRTGRICERLGWSGQRSYSAAAAAAAAAAAQVLRKILPPAEVEMPVRPPCGLAPPVALRTHA
jgi:hypothetical protein